MCRSWSTSASGPTGTKRIERFAASNGLADRAHGGAAQSKLDTVETGIGAFFAQQFTMRPDLDHTSLVEDDDAICILHRRQSMRDNDCRSPAHQRFQPGLHVPLRFRIERRGRLVQDQDRGVLQQGARDGDALALPAGQRDAAFADRRFPQLQKEEYDQIKIEISALTAPSPVASAQAIRIGTDGMVLSKDGRSAVFLPQVAPEQGWDLETTLTHLSTKAGLAPDAWKDGASFEVFQAEVFGEQE